MNISSVQSASQSLFTAGSRLKGVTLRSGDDFRNHKPMPREVPGGRDRDRGPLPAERINRFGGPLPGLRVGRDGGNPMPSQPVDQLTGSRPVLQGQKGIHNPMPREEIKLGGGFPLPAIPITSDLALNRMRGGRGTGPLPAQELPTASRLMNPQFQSFKNDSIDYSA